MVITSIEHHVLAKQAPPSLVEITAMYNSLSFYDNANGVYFGFVLYKISLGFVECQATACVYTCTATCRRKTHAQI